MRVESCQCHSHSLEQQLTLLKHMFNFEKLDVWQKAIQFADLVYSVTKAFRHSHDDYARFLEIATGSVFEVVSQSFIGRNQGFLDEENFRALYLAAEEQSRMLTGLRRSLSMP